MGFIGFLCQLMVGCSFEKVGFLLEFSSPFLQVSPNLCLQTLAVTSDSHGMAGSLAAHIIGTIATTQVTIRPSNLVLPFSYSIFPEVINHIICFVTISWKTITNALFESTFGPCDPNPYIVR